MIIRGPAVFNPLHFASELGFLQVRPDPLASAIPTVPLRVVVRIGPDGLHALVDVQQIIDVFGLYPAPIPVAAMTEPKVCGNLEAEMINVLLIARGWCRCYW